jgi:hypothetical protein
MPRGVWSKKDERQYKAIVSSCSKPKKVCRRIAAAVVNKRRALEGRTKTIGCHCPKGTRPLKSDKAKCYNARTRKRVRRIC